MKKFLPLAIALVLVGCTKSQGVSLEYLLTNPLYAERYADEMVDSLVELKIQDDPILEDASIAKTVEQQRQKWLKVAQEATKIQRTGGLGVFIPVNAHVTSEALYIDDTLYLNPITRIAPGPDLHVYLSTIVDPRDVEFPDATAVDLGPLKSPYGAQRYSVPAKDKPELYRTVAIWDNTLNRVWGFAQLGW